MFRVNVVAGGIAVLALLFDETGIWSWLLVAIPSGGRYYDLNGHGDYFSQFAHGLATCTEMEPSGFLVAMLAETPNRISPAERLMLS